MPGPAPERPRPERPVDIEGAYRKAEELAEREAIRPESFLHEESPYSQGVVSDDLRYVSERKSRFGGTESQEYHLAKALEGALYDRVNRSRWFGDRAHMIMPSEYDDLRNGVDGIVEFETPAGATSHLGLAFDITYSGNPSQKFDIIKEQIDKGRLGFVKYFRSRDGKYEGVLRHLPRAVVHVSQGDAGRIVRDWHEGAPTEGGEYQALILYQLYVQLERFTAYAMAREQAQPKAPKVSLHLGSALQNVTGLLEGVVSREQRSALESHPSVRIIKQQLERFESSPFALAA